MKTRDEYLRALSNALSGYADDVKNDILSEFSAHFDEAVENGLSDEEIIAALGSIDEVRENIKLMYETADHGVNTNQWSNANQGSNSNQGSSSNQEGKKLFELSIEIEDNPEGDIGDNPEGEIGDNPEGAIGDEPEWGQGEKAKENRGRKSSSRGRSGETGLVLPDVDTIVIEGNLDVHMEPGDEGIWEYKPSMSIEIGFSLFKAFSFNREQFDIEFSVVGRTAKFTLPKGSGSLDIEILPSVRCIYMNGRHLEVYAEDLQLDELSVDTVSGDVGINGGMVQKLHVSSTSGDISADNVWGAAELESVSGDIAVYGHQGPELTAVTVSGDIELRTTSPNTKAHSTSGDIETRFRGPVVNCNVDTVSGDIYFSSESKDYTADVTSLPGYIDNLSGLPESGFFGRKTIGIGAGRVTLSTTSGDVTVS